MDRLSGAARVCYPRQQARGEGPVLCRPSPSTASPPACRSWLRRRQGPGV